MKIALSLVALVLGAPLVLAQGGSYSWNSTSPAPEELYPSALPVPIPPPPQELYPNAKPIPIPPPPQELYPNAQPIPIPPPPPIYPEIQPIPVPAPMIESVTPTQAMRPGEVTIRGTGLAHVKYVTIAGQPVQILSISDTEIVVLAPFTDPGWMMVEVEVESHVTSQAVIEMCPSLLASVQGTSLDVRLGNGDDGMYILAANLELRPQPLLLGKPLTDYMFFLEDDFVILSAGLVLDPEKLIMGFEIPPALQGFTLYLQAWTQQNWAPQQYAHCFTNLFSVQL